MTLRPERYRRVTKMPRCIARDYFPCAPIEDCSDCHQQKQSHITFRFIEIPQSEKSA